MNSFTFEKKTVQLETLYNLFLQFPSVQTDTRKIKEGDSWGSNYNLNNQKIYAWTALNGATSFLEWGLGMHMNFDQFIEIYSKKL